MEEAALTSVYFGLALEAGGNGATGEGLGDESAGRGVSPARLRGARWTQPPAAGFQSRLRSLSALPSRPRVSAGHPPPTLPPRGLSVTDVTRMAHLLSFGVCVACASVGRSDRPSSVWQLRGPNPGPEAKGNKSWGQKVNWPLAFFLAVASCPSVSSWLPRHIPMKERVLAVARPQAWRDEAYTPGSFPLGLCLGHPAAPRGHRQAWRVGCAGPGADRWPGPGTLHGQWGRGEQWPEALGTGGESVAENTRVT